MIWFVYVIRSNKDNIFYSGMSQNVNKRIEEHNSGKSTFTKAHMPWILIYQEECPSIKNARIREKYFKSAAGRRFIHKII
jgi:putative endonuclease